MHRVFLQNPKLGDSKGGDFFSPGFSLTARTGCMPPAHCVALGLGQSGSPPKLRLLARLAINQLTSVASKHSLLPNGKHASSE